MYGLFKENGPFLVKAEEPPHGHPYLVTNEYSWHKLANIVYIDNPVGTGFSHVKDSTWYGYGMEEHQVAKELSEFLLQFMQIFPHYVGGQTQPKVYFFGESYGGTYVVTLADYILSNEIYKVSYKPS